MVRPGASGLGAAALVAVLALGGCMRSAEPGVGMAGTQSPALPAAAEGSALIAELATRPSILPPGSSYDRIRSGVAATGRGAAAAELRMARLRAEARSSNWLPQIGPSLDLTSLGGLAASLLAEAVLFDNGKRKAERAFAAADVEVAAISLTEEANDRLHDALEQHVAADRARVQGAVAEGAVQRLTELSRVAAIRLQGGLADRAEARSIEAKLAEARSMARSDALALADAQEALAALAGPVAEGASGLADLPLPTAGLAALAVLRAEAEGRRMLAEARIDRAGHLPGLGVTARAGEGGIDAGLRLGAERMFGMGSAASLEALEATESLAADRIADARDSAARNRATVEREIAALRAEMAEGAALAARGAEDLHLMEQQHRAGLRKLTELAHAIEAQAALERAQAGLPHRIAALHLRLARDHGLLAGGAGL